MPKISITSLKKEIFCTHGTQTVLSSIQENAIDWMHACGAKGRCTTCSMVVINGYENLSPQTKNERFYIDRAMIEPNVRLACQCTLLGDITISVPESGRLPHMKYFD